MDNPKKIEFGREIRARRKAKGWNQSVFAEIIGTTPTTVGRWENGKTEPGPIARFVRRVTADVNRARTNEVTA